MSGFGSPLSINTSLRTQRTRTTRRIDNPLRPQRPLPGAINTTTFKRYLRDTNRNAHPVEDLVNALSNHFVDQDMSNVARGGTMQISNNIERMCRTLRGDMNNNSENPSVENRYRQAIVKLQEYLE